MAWKTHASKTVYESPWTKVTVDEVETETGQKLSWDLVHRPAFAMVIPWDGERFTLVGLYRYGASKFSWEFPAGNSDHGTMEESAAEELRQETGLRAKKIEEIGSLFVSSGFTNAKAHIFFATGLTEGEPEREGPAEEGMQMKKVTREELRAMIARGEITDMTTVASFGILGEKNLLE